MTFTLALELLLPSLALGLLGLWLTRGRRAHGLLFRAAGLSSLILGLLGCGLAGYVSSLLLRRQPPPLREAWFQGIHYERIVQRTPRPVVAHLVSVDLQAVGIGLVVTPGAPSAHGEVRSQTTRAFARKHQVQLAINASYFYPFRNEHPLDYEPHPGDPVHVLGFTAAGGIPYGRPLDGQATVHFSRDNQLTFDAPKRELWSAISGMGYVVRQGAKARFRRDDFTNVPYPRTLLAADRSARRMLWLVVDGKQPGYSEGLTLDEAAQWLLERGAFNAVQLDGGGSATLVRRSAAEAELVSTPSNFKIPGWERSIATHLGVKALPLSR